jgi:uncharacterized protein DUF6962
VLTEVSTMLTDYALAAVTAVMAVALVRAAAGRTAMLLWAGGFVALSVSAIAGGTFHGFALTLPASMLAALWEVSTWTVGALSFCLVGGAAVAYTRGRVRLAVLSLAAVKLLVYLVWMSRHDEFRFAIYDTGITMGVVLGLALYGRTRRETSATWLLAGIALSAVAAVVQYRGVQLHASFNHNDLYHVVQAAAMYFFYRGGRAFGAIPVRRRDGRDAAEGLSTVK